MRRSHTDTKLPELEREHPSTLWGCWWTSWSAQCCTLTLIRPCKIYIGNGISEYIVVSLEFILGSWVPANLKGCSRAEDFDTKWVHIKKAGALWSVYDGSPEQKYPFIGKVLWSNLIPGSRGSSSSSFRFFFSCHHLPEGVDLKNLHTFQRLRDDYPSRFWLIFRKFLNLKIQKFSLQNFGV